MCALCLWFIVKGSMDKVFETAICYVAVVATELHRSCSSLSLSLCVYACCCACVCVCLCRCVALVRTQLVVLNCCEGESCVCVCMGVFCR